MLDMDLDLKQMSNIKELCIVIIDYKVILVLN